MLSSLPSRLVLEPIDRLVAPPAPGKRLLDLDGEPESSIKPSQKGQLRLTIAYHPDILVEGTSIDLTRLQSRICSVLLGAEGPVSTKVIAEEAWFGRRVSTHTVHSQMNLLRMRLNDFGIALRNERGRGYWLEDAGAGG